VRISSPESLRRHNTLALPACASHFARIDSAGDLLEALEWADVRQLPVIPLGQGSNVVLANDLQALVLRIATQGREVLDRNDSRVQLRVQAGEDWHALVSWTLEQGYFGLENLALIPGTVGAAPIQNIGAYGVELDTLVVAVHALDRVTGEALVLDREACQFAYRDSAFKGDLRDQLVITAVDFSLSRRCTVQLGYPALAEHLQEKGVQDIDAKAVFDAVVELRRSRLPDPGVAPNAGSFFKNPLITANVADELRERYPDLPCYPQESGAVKLPAAWMIQACGWKGRREGEVGVHPGHALVLVNHGAASGQQLLQFAGRVADSVRDKFGVELEIEPRVYGS